MDELNGPGRQYHPDVSPGLAGWSRRRRGRSTPLPADDPGLYDADRPDDGRAGTPGQTGGRRLAHRHGHPVYRLCTQFPGLARGVTQCGEPPQFSPRRQSQRPGHQPGASPGTGTGGGAADLPESRLGLRSEHRVVLRSSDRAFSLETQASAAARKSRTFLRCRSSGTTTRPPLSAHAQCTASSCAVYFWQQRAVGLAAAAGAQRLPYEL